MQPYFFPHLAYFQLINAADTFVCLDNVQHIRRGWINRNRILLSGTVHTFTVPIEKGNREDLILDKCLSKGVSDELAQDAFEQVISELGPLLRKQLGT